MQLRTQYKQCAEITSVIPIVGNKVESYSVDIVCGNACKGLTAMEELCQQWAIDGKDGINRILNTRLNTIELSQNIHLLKQQITNNLLCRNRL